MSTSTTLAASEDSFFSRLLGAEGSQRGEIFIDRCGRLFSHVLEHLRSLRYGESPAPLPSHPEDLKALQREVWLLAPCTFFSSLILSTATIKWQSLKRLTEEVHER